MEKKSSYVIMSILFAVSLILSVQGVFLATYVIIALTAFHYIFTIYSSTVITVYVINKEGEDLPYVENRKFYTAVLLCFLMAASYHLYQLGYIFYSGALASTITMSTLVFLLDLSGIFKNVNR
jgi:hypothetical protein